MLTRLSTFLVLVCSATLVAADVPDYSATPVPSSFKTYFDPAGRYTIQYPPNWQVQAQGPATYIRLVGPDGTVLVNLDIVTSPMGNATLGDIVNTSRQQLTSANPLLRSVLAQPARFGNLQAYHTRYAGFMGGKNIEMSQVLINRNGTMYVLSYAAKPGDFETYNPTIRQIVSSFRPAGQ